MEEINVEVATMVASSPTLGTSDELINSEDALGNERRRGNWGNLWGDEE